MGARKVGEFGKRGGGRRDKAEKRVSGESLDGGGNRVRVRETKAGTKGLLDEGRNCEKTKKCGGEKAIWDRKKLGSRKKSGGEKKGAFWTLAADGGVTQRGGWDPTSGSVKAPKKQRGTERSGKTAQNGGGDKISPMMTTLGLPQKAWGEKERVR